MIKRGDHIKIRFSAFEHHGIYIGNGLVIHFTGVASGKDAATIRFGTIRNFAGHAGVSAIVVVQYARCLPPETVVARAHSQVGRSGYDVFRNNCEQLARWCKTGEFVSAQVEVAKAVGGAVGGGATATATALGLVSLSGAVGGMSGPGIMSGLAAAGTVIGGGAASGIGVLAVAPAAVAVAATRHAYRDDPHLAAEERTALRSGRQAAAFGAVAGTVGTVATLSAAGVPGLSAVGISTGFTAIGGSMIGGVAIAIAAPAVAAAGLAWIAYRLGRRRRG